MTTENKPYQKYVNCVIANEPKEILIRNTSAEEHEESIELMASHLYDQENGKVGLF